MLCVLGLRRLVERETVNLKGDGIQTRGSPSAEAHGEELLMGQRTVEHRMGRKEEHQMSCVHEG